MSAEKVENVPLSPTEPYRFCPADGTSLSGPRPSGGATCPLCGRSWYRNPAPAVGAAILNGDRALVTVRAREPYRGKVDVPGGFLELGEHPVDGLRREVREELGLEIAVDPMPVLLAPHTYGPEGVWVLAIGFRARILEGTPAPADDVAEARWIGAGEVEGVDFAWEHDRGFVRAALAQRD
ncbi:MAG: hypothetical protein AVDCRST_MAG22-1885 [uncultured Rubrobacteraceae bacterium]|uniref:Nudix hydrolase domain-containing protein n=1 Tax=uncultured Rubrobacteraceae bacterium TaxID=349277 RepID=A0A6J4PIK2_9ACTN|nr:MAG: hypothetical protein AVDCRST_MAG22-1885 [uncultured Rubrobacteraceae bacterium]